MVGLAIGLFIGLAWPVFCLIWFGFVKTKPEQMTGGVRERIAHVSAWRATWCDSQFRSANFAALEEKDRDGKQPGDLHEAVERDQSDVSQRDHVRLRDGVDEPEELKIGND